MVVAMVPPIMEGLAPPGAAKLYMNEPFLIFTSTLREHYRDQPHSQLRKLRHREVKELTCPKSHS